VPSVVVTLWIVNRPTAECESAQDESAEDDANHLPIDRQHNCHHIIARVQLQHSWRIGFACRSESIGLYRNDSVKACSSHGKRTFLARTTRAKRERFRPNCDSAHHVSKRARMLTVYFTRCEICRRFVDVG